MDASCFICFFTILNGFLGPRTDSDCRRHANKKTFLMDQMCLKIISLRDVMALKDHLCVQICDAVTVS
jgi:hypothetical protein